jgi:PPOX class probable F420-dependent enzyme
MDQNRPALATARQSAHCALVFRDWELRLIEDARVGRLATVTRGGRPHLVPVCYAFVGGRFAIAIDEKPKSGRRLARLGNIERDPRVSLLIDHYGDDWSQLAWVRIDGEAAIHERGDSWPEALVALRTRYRQYAAMALEALPLIEILPSNAASWRWGTP